MGRRRWRRGQHPPRLKRPARLGAARGHQGRRGQHRRHRRRAEPDPAGLPRSDTCTLAEHGDLSS
ncbi:hypothetical protein BV133_1923 [Blastochloris viridis]|uniref:Uncharacterized protein n=1 Tax=Blastochloris viridis TaxID=1079 RepID=A0A182D1W9_BLAVI|nr:hypothetical protein BV133_1923 [Blastochloris viridis]